MKPIPSIPSNCYGTKIQKFDDKLIAGGNKKVLQLYEKKFGKISYIT